MKKRGNDICKQKTKNLKKNRRAWQVGCAGLAKSSIGRPESPTPLFGQRDESQLQNFFRCASSISLSLSGCHLSPLPVRIASISPLSLQVGFPPFPLFTVVQCGILKSSSFNAFLRIYGSGFVSSCSNFNGFMLGRMIWLGFLVFIWYFLRRFRKFVKGSFFFLSFTV